MMYIFFTGLILCLVTGPRPGLLYDALNAVPESDDDKLNQALILVDILKLEYLKLLRERSESATTAAGMVEQPTCAPTTAHSVPTETSSSPREQNNQTLVAQPYTEWARIRPRGPGPVYPWGWPVPGTTVLSRRFYDMMPQPAQLQYSNLYSLPRRPGPYRRNFPEYSYYYGPYRRSEYYDENPNQTTRGHYRRKEYDENLIEAASDSPERIVTTKTAAATLRKHSKKNTNARPDPDTTRRRYTQSRRIYKHNFRRSDDANQKQKPANETKNISNATKIIPTAKNYSATVKGAGPAGNGTTTTAIISSSSRKIPKTKVTAHASPEVWPAFRFKTTLRIFLENSTPLPIPFPDNNAFCFTNPNNALCRSP